MIRPTCITIAVLSFLCMNLAAQTDTVPFAVQATKENRLKEYRYLLNNSILKNLSLDLSDSTEENWQEAFEAMELIRYTAPFTENRIRYAFDSIERRSISFQRSFLELVYTLYPKDFQRQMIALVNKTSNPKLFAMGAEYILQHTTSENVLRLLRRKLSDILSGLPGSAPDPICTSISNRLALKKEKSPPLNDLLNTEFLKNEIVLYSFQRKNRNYPGLAIVRGKDGVLIKDKNGNYFSVPQLARSNSNMPGYLTNGNTPQGIFRMTGFDVSKGNFIGPTTNIQMVMPFERSNEVSDTITQSLGIKYRSLLPVSWQDYEPAYEAYYAGKAGRSEIIAHGTTVNPEYYTNQPYYPLTPTQGCLCTRELWSPVDGKRTVSDQQELVNALQAAGGANGYCIVVEIDDQLRPVNLADILPYLKKQK